ncbi:MAG: zinc ribbon domain-containing protein [Dehalococcoidales bacterium]|nr:zinc ribbon domain-containing protein [Dehalococcoidales bacterium]
MRCSRCNFVNEEGAAFCGNCGTELVIDEPVDSISEIPTHVDEIICSRCNAPNTRDSVFCKNCGSRLSPEIQQQPDIKATTQVKTSAAWWLLPIFMAWIGGLIAFLVVKDSDRNKAVKLLWTGIGLTIFWIIVSVAVSVIPYLIIGY